MSTNTINVDDVASAIPAGLVAAEVVEVIHNSAVLGNLVNRDASRTVARAGDVVTIPRRGLLERKNKAKDSTVTKQVPSDSGVQVALDKHQEVTFLVEDVARMKAEPDYYMGYLRDAVAVLAAGLDLDILNMYTDLTYEVGTAGVDATPDIIVDARKELLTNGKVLAQVQPKYYVMSYKDEAALLKTEKFTSAEKIGDDGTALREASLGRRYGVNLIAHSQVDTSGTSPISTHGVLFTPDAFALVTRPMPTDGNGLGVRQEIAIANGIAMRITRSYDTDYLALKTTVDLLYGVKVRQPELAVEVLT